MNAKPIRVLVVQDANATFCPSLDGEYFEPQPVRPEDLERAILASNAEPQLVVLREGGSPKQLSVVLKQIRALAANVPVLILPDATEDQEANEGASKGSQASESKLKADKLSRVVLASMRQNRLRPELRHLALIDDLTGLHNREGFLLLGSERMKMANGIKKNLLVFFADLDNLKEINERFGVQEGDRALVKTGEIFRKTFRNADLTSRFGGDEFAALVVEDAQQSADSITHRLQENMNQLQATENDYHLSLSVGMTRYVAETSASLKKLLAEAAHSQNEQLLAKRAEANAKVVLTFRAKPNGAEGNTSRGHLNSWQDSRTARKSSGGET